VLPKVAVARLFASSPPQILTDQLIEEALTMATASSSTTGPTIIDGKATADTIRDELKARVATLMQTHGRVRVKPRYEARILGLETHSQRTLAIDHHRLFLILPLLNAGSRTRGGACWEPHRQRDVRSHEEEGVC
jgi:hypothetical protein